MAPPTARTAPIPLLVLTGFLGSGKTTLLNRLLAQPSMADTAVIINEFGPVGIDHLLVEALADDVLLLESGCICCSAGDDLALTLASLLTRRGSGDLPPFQRIVLEMSGVADPGRLLQRLLADPLLGAHVCIHGVMTVVDAVFGSVTLERHPENAQQVALANQLALSKLDLAEATAVAALRARLRATNPLASFFETARLDGARLFEDVGRAGVSFAAAPPPTVPSLSAPSGQPMTSRTHGTHHADRYSAFCLRGEEPVNWADFKSWLEALLLARGESILRIKGLLNVTGRPRPQLIQGVQHALYPCAELPAWPRGRPCSEIVLVTRDFSSSAALRSLQQCLPRGPKFTEVQRDAPRTV
jgi:G3E family GTPase